MAGLILTPGLQSQEGNRSSGLYLSKYGILFLWLPRWKGPHKHAVKVSFDGYNAVMHSCMQNVGHSTLYVQSCPNARVQMVHIVGVKKTVTFPFCSAQSKSNGAACSMHKKRRQNGGGVQQR